MDIPNCEEDKHNWLFEDKNLVDYWYCTKCDVIAYHFPSAKMLHRLCTRIIEEGENTLFLVRVKSGHKRNLSTFRYGRGGPQGKVICELEYSQLIVEFSCQELIEYLEQIHRTENTRTWKQD